MESFTVLHLQDGVGSGGDPTGNRTQIGLGILTSPRLRPLQFKFFPSGQDGYHHGKLSLRKENSDLFLCICTTVFSILGNGATKILTVDIVSKQLYRYLDTKLQFLELHTHLLGNLAHCIKTLHTNQNTWK